MSRAKMVEPARKRALVADDDDSVRTLIAEVLSRAGFDDVLVVSDGCAALAAVETESLDLAVLDVEMPGASGLEVLEYVQDLGLTLPIIVVSGSGEENQRRAREAGARVFIAKPFALSTILEAVDAVVGGDR